MHGAVGSISAAVFAGVLALFAAVALFAAARRQARVHALRRRLGSLDRGESSLLRGASGDAGARGVAALARLAANAGWGWDAGTFATRIVLSALGAALVGGLVGGAALAILFAPLGAVILPLAARSAHARRVVQCDAQLPQALEVMALALRAGHPLPGALAIAAAEAPTPLADELRRAVDEHDLGRPMGDVLVQLGERLAGGEHVHTFVVAVLVLQQTGGNLIGVIERIVENARARAHYQQRLRALTAEGRSSARLLAALPGAFGVLAAMSDPSYASTLFGDPTGNVVLAITLTLWALGILWTRHLVRSDA
jgi:tight adherence protein B